MSGYAKLFTRILDSTIWREDDPTRILWITMLALADRNGDVYCTIPGLADRARITLIECEKALERFQLPDKYSWSQEEEGRRIHTIKGGWHLINHAKFRQMMSAEEQREKTRIRVNRWREKNKKPVTLPVTPAVTFNESNDIADATTTTAVTGINSSSNGKIYKGGGVLAKNTKSTPPPSPQIQKFTQSDFDERDLRKLATAEKELGQSYKAMIGADVSVTDEQFFTQVCEIAGISVERGLKLKEQQRKWPER